MKKEFEDLLIGLLMEYNKANVNKDIEMASEILSIIDRIKEAKRSYTSLKVN